MTTSTWTSFILVATLTCLSQLAQVAQSKKIAIIGSGVAGMSAARKLQDEVGDEYEIVVLEANPDRYGGRIKTDSTTFGVSVDLGASWIHGYIPQNPLTKLAMKYSIQTVATDDLAQITWNRDSVEYTDRQLYNGFEAFYEMLTTVEEASADYENDISVRAAITRENLDTTYQEPLVLLYATTDIEASYAAPTSNLSVKMIQEGGDDFEGEDRIFPGGYMQIIEALKNGGSASDSSNQINILLNHKVTKITVNANDNVTMTLDNGQSVTADRVVLAVPLGVLKAGDITFEPELSEAKQDAIDQLGFGLLNKLVFEFDEAFWPEDVDYFLLAPDNEEDMGMLVLWLSLSRVVNKPILLAFISGEAATNSELLSDDELKQKGLDQLSIMFGGTNVTGFVKMVRTKWRADEFARGSYSYPAVGNTPEMRQTLREPEGDDPILFFAGEHTHDDHYATVHGAYITGERAAKEVLDSISGATCLLPLLLPTVLSVAIQCVTRLT